MNLLNFSLRSQDYSDLANWVFDGGPKDSKIVISHKNLKLVIHRVALYLTPQGSFVSSSLLVQIFRVLV